MEVSSKVSPLPSIQNQKTFQMYNECCTTKKCELIRCDYIQLPNKALKSSRLRVDAERYSVSFLLFQNELMNNFCTGENSYR